MNTLIEFSPTLLTNGWSASANAAVDSDAHVRDHDADGSLAVETLTRARSLGLSTALVPREFGGGGASHAEMGGVLREIAHTDAAAAVTLAMHSHLVAFHVWRQRHGQDASPMFAKVTDGAWLVSTGAADWVSSSGTARKVDGGYRVSAAKAPASGCELGDLLVTSIRWAEPGAAPQVLHCVVPFAAEGVRVERTWDTLGLRGTGSHTVVLDDVFVPEAAVSLIRPADVWHPVWNIVVGAALPLIMAAYNGIADAAVDAALAMVSARNDDSAQQTAGEMVTAHLMGSESVDAMFVASDNLNYENTDAHSAAVMARKRTATDAFVDTVRLAMELVGGRSYFRGNPFEHMYRDMLGAQFHPLPRARQSRFTGRVALGLDPLGAVPPA
ncbi:MAG: acyl-CoA/acyl-ACP dehydrogenase [Actinobacteria bacterium]|nr:acyl-CoA/acyl-ACP dehydrogenase [Actinomycetota bacterium]